MERLQSKRGQRRNWSNLQSGKCVRKADH